VLATLLDHGSCTESLRNKAPTYRVRVLEATTRRRAGLGYGVATVPVSAVLLATETKTKRERSKDPVFDLTLSPFVAVNCGCFEFRCKKTRSNASTEKSSLQCVVCGV
jgi:hypothetical protein